MLSGVLLHMIETAGPVDEASHRTGLTQSCIEYMNDAILFIHHVNYGSSLQRSPVERLAAGGRIKRRSIQNHAPAIRANVNHVSPKFGQVAVVVVEPLGH